MRLGIPVETREGETRIVATPETIKKVTVAKHQVVAQTGVCFRRASRTMPCAR